MHAFADSRNIPAVKLAERVGIRKVIATAHQFGLSSTIPPFLPVALGSVEATLEEQVAAYSSFPNDGVRLGPHLIRKVTNADGLTLSESPANVAESTSQKTARTMMTLLKAVIGPGGTAADAMALHHPLGGKTGTTSDFNDAWFIGFSPSITCGVWVGYDNRQSMGDKESGGHAALPLWIDFMKVAIADHPDEHFPGDTTPAASNQCGDKERLQPPSGRRPSHSRSTSSGSGLPFTRPSQRERLCSPSPQCPIPCDFWRSESRECRAAVAIRGFAAKMGTPSAASMDKAQRRGCRSLPSTRIKCRYRFACPTSRMICSFKASGEGHRRSSRSRR